MARTAWAFGFFAGLLLVATAAWAEQVEIVTYYPSPSATTDDLRVKRATVGTTYKTLNFDDPSAPVADGTLLVAGNLGAGVVNNAPPPFAAAPNGQTTGNLTVNDLFLRSVNAWASEAVAGGVEPTNPSLVYLTVQPATFAGVDAYNELELWKLGISRGQVRMTSWRTFRIGPQGEWMLLQDSHGFTQWFTATNPDGSTYYYDTPSQTLVVAPTCMNGVIAVRRNNDVQGKMPQNSFATSTSIVSGDVYEVTVAW